jgi:putative ABC transport system ATP-binding protein
MQLLSVRGAGMRVGERVLWAGVDLDVTAGERVGIRGPSGSGKSMLLRAMAALVPLGEGRVAYRGRTPEEMGVPTFRSCVMYVPQNPSLPPGTVESLLRMPFGWAAHSRARFVRDEAVDLLVSLGRPPDLLGAESVSLSGGEVQSVLLVRALLLSPSVLLLDEVTSALDQDLAHRAEELILRWCGQGERAVVWVGHDPGSRSRIASRSWDLPVSLVAEHG